MLQPKKQKYRKQFKGKIKGKSFRGAEVSFGEYGLKALEGSLITARQIEAARRAITHHTKRAGKIWIRIFPDKPVSKKPQEVGMGGGKAPVNHFAAVVKPGRILFEIAGVEKDLAEEAMRLASHKLPIKTKFVSRG